MNGDGQTNRRANTGSCEEMSLCNTELSEGQGQEIQQGAVVKSKTESQRKQRLLRRHSREVPAMPLRLTEYTHKRSPLRKECQVRDSHWKEVCSPQSYTEQAVTVPTPPDVALFKKKINKKPDTLILCLMLRKIIS